MYIYSTLIQRSMNEPSWRSPMPGRPRICCKVTCRWILACKCEHFMLRLFAFFRPSHEGATSIAVLVVQDT